MLVSGVSSGELVEVVEKVGKEWFEGNVVARGEPRVVGKRLALGLTVLKGGMVGAKRGERQQRQKAACIHAYGRVVAAIVEGWPLAEVYVSGLGNFNRANYKRLLPKYVDGYLGALGKESGPCWCDGGESA